MGSHFLRDLATTWPPNTPTHLELLDAADRLDKLEAEVERLREEVAIYRLALANALGIPQPLPAPTEEE